MTADLWKLWKQEQLTTEMAVGYLIQNQVNHEQAMLAVQQTQTSHRSDLEQVVAQVKIHQKILESLQPAFAKLQSVVDGLVRNSKRFIRKDEPNLGA